MYYSLLSRFQGALLGSAIGAALSTPVPQDNQRPNWYKILHYQSSEQIDRLKQVGFIWGETEKPKEEYSQLKFSSSGEAAYLCLPIILFYHENFSLLQQKIRQIGQSWQWSAEVLEDVLIWGYIVALILRENLDTKNIIKQILVGVGERPTPLWQMLKQVELWLIENQSLEQVVEKLSHQTKEWSIPLSLYCFNSTPEDFSLSICRATNYQRQAKITAMLTGSLAGGYNSIVGIPTNWRKISYQNSLYQAIKQQGKILFDNWSGVYRANLNESIIEREAIAAPGTIQTRSSLRIISQQE